MYDVSVDEVIDFCDFHGIDVRESGSHLVFRHCPSCDSEKWKVSLYDDSFRGKCFRCDETFSIYSYLVETGIEVPEVKKLLYKGGVTKTDEGLIDIPHLSLEKKPEKETISKINTSVDLSKFFRIDEWPDHKSSLYAKKRGVPEDLYDKILISVDTYGVVFLSHDYYTKVCNGYQIRYVNPLTQAKTYNLPGFQTAENIIVYERKGADIVVCEGPFNAVSAYNYGYTGVSTFGSNFSYNQAMMIMDLADKKKCGVISGFDMDEAGEKGFLIMRDICSEYGYSLKKLIPTTGDLNDSWMEGKGFTIQDNPEGSHFSMIGGLFEKRRYRKG